MIRDQSYGVIPLKREKGQWRVLLIYHKNGNHWGFPKGHKIEHEDDLEAAFRELQEETGLEVQELLRQEPFVEIFQFRRHGEWIEKTVSYYPAIVKGEIKIQVEEIRDACWLSIEQALQRLSFEEARSICRQVDQDILRNK